VADLSSTAAISAAETLGIPCVVNNPDLLTMLPAGLLPAAPEVPLPLSGKSIGSISPLRRRLNPLQSFVGARLTNALVGRPLNAARRARGLGKIDFQRWLRDKQILVNSAFGLEYPRRLRPNVHMVGPMLTESPEALPADYTAWLEAADGKPVLYANLGTIARPWPELLQRMAAAFSTQQFRTLWVVPADLQSLLPDSLPETVRVERWVPSQLGVLRHPNVRAFVSHCGVNSVHEAIWSDTPVIGMPLFAAQGDMALRVQDARVGSHLDKQRFTPEQLRAHILAACGDVEVRRNMATIRQTFVAAGGVRRAVDLIEQAALNTPGTRPYAARRA
jgi:UDP:flavonoid glycosyltransferase YjiC (YdhE family)